MDAFIEFWDSGLSGPLPPEFKITVPLPSVTLLDRESSFVSDTYVKTRILSRRDAEPTTEQARAPGADGR